MAPRKEINVTILIKLKENEIEEFAWYSKEEALSIAVSGFDYSAIKNL